MDLDSFRNPPASHRSMPLWVWNGEMTEARITEMLGQFAAQGMGGVFVHPRPGLITEYLSERWFELWNHALTECRRLGLECNIYDENSYPAGFAGGHVSARLPHAVSQYVEAVVHRRSPVRFEGQLLAVCRLLSSGATESLPLEAKLDEAVKAGPVLTMALRCASGSPWTAWFPMVDITRPEVAREFIATTYEPYAKRFGDDFGKTITSIFCDEPQVTTAGAYSCAVGLPLSWFFLGEFQREHGYALPDKLAGLFVDLEGAEAVRFDYYRTLQRLWTQNFMKPLYEWCAASGVRLTGHFMEQEWPYPFLNPSCMEGYRWMHMPGVDLLAPQFDFQHPERAAHYAMTLRELNSAANQLGYSRRLCETHGVGGYEAVFEDFKRLSDWLMVQGVNFINQHLSFQTISGARKYDHPQTFSDHSAWWDSYRLHADHVARLSVILSEGEQRCRVLVLHSTTSGWVQANPARQAFFNDTKADGFQPIQAFLSGMTSQRMEALRQSEASLIQGLADHQVDFDLGDELLLADLGRANDAQLAVGACSYSVVVLPEGMDNWCATTLELIEHYLVGGGAIVSLREPPVLINGRPDPRPAQLAKKFASQWQRVASLETLQTALDQVVPPLITTADGGRLPTLVGHHRRLLENGDTLHFLANHGHAPVRIEVQVPGASLRNLETFTGEANEMECRRTDSNLVALLELAPAGHVVWLVSEKEIAAKRYRQPAGSMEDEQIIEIAQFERIERTAPNVLALDFCDLTVAGQTHAGLYVTRANRLCWQAHGFDQDVWDRAVQFRRNYFGFSFDRDSGFKAEYHFHIDPSAVTALQKKGGLELALERPELYGVELNGHKITFAPGRRWLDETIRAMPVENLLRPGANHVSLTVHPFHILCEIDRIYLLGDFALDPVASGFSIIPPATLRIGDWTRQGLAQYPGSVRYATRINLERPTSNWRIEIPRWAGSVIRISLDGQETGCVAFPPYQLKGRKPLDAGGHDLVIEVVGTPKNLLGPHFSGSPLPGRWTGPGSWDACPQSPVPGSDYEILPYGLLAAARFVVETS